MKIVITGASGFVGAQLAERLLAAGETLVLVGRDTERLQRQFPSATVAGFDAIPRLAQGFDALVHCASLPYRPDRPEEAVLADNLALHLQARAMAEAAGIARVIFLSSFHALEAGNDSPYARGKRAIAAHLLATATPASRSTILYLPAVHGARFVGKLGVLNRAPAFARPALLMLLAALKPVVSIATIASAVTAIGADPAPRAEIELADDIGRNPVYRAFRFLLDAGFALTVLVLLSWLLAAVWLAVRLQSTGPGIFAQPRVGRDGRTFTCYKFRTMRRDTAQAGTHEVSHSAITRIGAVLRRTKIDELPQAINILSGEMSLIGPRPCLPSQTGVVEARRAAGVLSLTPGITGLSQVRQIDMSEPEALAASDRRYGAMRCILLDLKILLATATGRGGGDRVRPPAA